MADLQEFYKNARKKGIIDQSVDYASFEQAMRDERQRQDFYQYATNEGLRIGTPERFGEYISTHLPDAEGMKPAGGVSGGSLLSEQEELARQNAYQGVTNDPNHPFVEKRPSFWQSIGGHNPYPISATTDIQGRSRQQQQEAAAQDAARAQAELESMLAPYKEQFEAQWKQDAPVLDEVWNKANKRAKAAAESVQRNKPQQVNLPSVMGGGFGNIGYSLIASREANKQNSPEAIIEAFERELDNKYQSKDVKGDIQLAQEMGATIDEYQLYKRFVEDKIAERFVGQNIPQDKLDYFARKFIQGNLIAQLASLYTQSPQSRQYAMQGTQQYEQANPGWATKGVAIGAEVANVVADPLMWIMPGVGEAAGRGIVNAAGRRLASVGLSDAAGAAERAAMQRGLLRTAQRLTSGGVMMAGIDTGHTLVGDLYQTGEVNWSNLATAPIRGALTGMAFAGGGALGERVQKAVGDVFGRDLGLVAGRATHFAAGTNIMVGSSVASHILQGGSPDDIDWGIEYANAAAMQLFFDIQGGLKTASKAKGFGNAWKAMRQDPMAHTLTREEIEQFNAVGIEGNDAYTILKNLNGGKEFTSLEEYYKVLNDISADERIDTQAKYKLASLLYGKVDAHVSPIYVGDVEAVADGYVVKTYDNGGMTYETRKFDTQRAADVYRARQHDATRNNMLEWVEGIIRTRGFAEKMQEVTDGAINKTIENYPQLSREDAYRVLSADEGSLTPIERAIRGQMEKYLAEDIKGSDILKDVREQVAREQGVSIDDLSNLLSREYSRLSAKDKTVFENYLDRLNEYMPRNNDRTERRAIGEGGGLGPQQAQETTPLSPAAAEHQRAVDEVTQAVGERTHGNGYIYPVAMPGNAEKTGFIVGEVVPVIDESDPEQLRIENDDIVTVKWSDGTVTQERARDLDLTGAPMMAQQAVDNEVENQMYAYTQQRIQNGEQPVLMRNREGILEGLFPTEGGLLEDQNGVQYTQEQLAEQGWQETKPVLFVNDTQQIAALDNGDGTYTQVDALGNPIAEPMSAEAFSEQGFAMVPLEEEQPKSQAPVEAPAVQQAPVEQAPEVQQPEVQETAEPVVPNIETMSADELGGSAVEYMGDRASAAAYLEAERDKADAEVQRTSKLKVTRFDGPEDFKRQNDQIQAAKRAAIDRYNKLQNAITAANAYKTLAEQKEEAERKAREAAMREQRRQLAEAEAAGDIEAKWQNTKKTFGFAATKTLPNGQKVNGHYILTEAGDVVPSHDPRKNYADSDGYVMENGQNVNDNNYKDPDVQRIALDIAQNYGGQAVEQMPFLENRAGRVLSGNNRTISGIIAAENNTDQAYLAALAENAQQYGFTPEQLAEYEHPRLQFVVEDELPFTTATFAMFNQQEKKTKSSVNRAVANSKMVTEAVRDKMLEIMDQYESLDSFFGSETAAADIVQALITEGLMTQQEVAGLTENTATGFKFGQSGREYVTDMLLGTLFDEQTIKMLAGEKTLKQAILRALPSIVANRRLKGYELTDSINNAIQLLYEARKANEGKSTADAFQLYLRQVDAFEGSVMDRYNGFDIILANRMSAGVEQLREILGLYNNSAMNEANGQMGFFEPRTIDDIKQDVYEYYTNQQPELAATLNGAAARGAQPESAVPGGTANEGEVRPTQREQLTEYLNGIADEEHPFELFDDASTEELLRSIGASEESIERVKIAVANGAHVNGIKYKGRIYLNVDECNTPELARTNYVHERQHLLTTKADLDRVFNAVSYQELNEIVDALAKHSGFYLGRDFNELADEFISFGMEAAYQAENDAELEAALRQVGANDKLVNIIKSINNEQRANENLSKGRRNAVLNDRSASSSPESGRDQTSEPAGVGEQGTGIDQRSLRRTEGGGSDISESGAEQVTATTTEDNAHLSDNESAFVAPQMPIDTQTNAQKQSKTPTEEEQQQAAQYLNEALQEVISKSGDKLPQNITIDENTIEDNPDSVEMTARLLIDGKPSDFSVTIFDQSLGARGGFDPVNMVKFYPREELDKWDWDLADRLAEEFNKTRTQESGLATVMDESDAVYFFNMQAALDFAEKARQEITPSDDPRFSISGTQVIPVGEKTLVGLHNISAEKLRKALKAGGLANPSAAVIDIARQNHHDYGDVSLVLSSNMVENSDGTYAGDAWTPMYPQVEYRQGKQTEKRIKALVKGLPKNLADGIYYRVGEYMDRNRNSSGLEYLFLKNKGEEMPILTNKRRYPDISIEDIYKRLGMEYPGYYDSSSFQAYEQLPEDQLFEFNLWLEKYGREVDIQRVKDKIAELREKGENKAADVLTERYSQPLFFNYYDSIGYRILRDERDAGEENIGETLDAADRKIDELGLRNEFEDWKQQMIDSFGYDEVLFAGWTSDGDRRYVKNTVENASRLMNKESETNYLDRQSVNETKAMLMDKLRTLSDIRKHKGQLEPDDEKIREAYEQASHDWGQLGIDFRDYTTNEDKTAYGLDDNPFTAIDTALARLQEAMFKRDPIAFLNREYRYSLPADSEFGTRLKEMVKRIKNLPSRYFETKFRRPVYLNEFANAVVPNDLPQDLRAGLESAGLRLFSYDPNAQGSRRDATLKATEADGIRFSINGNHRSSRGTMTGHNGMQSPVFADIKDQYLREMADIKDKAIKDGTFMQAPNGKPSRLNERQWLQVRTRAFKRWFGDWQNDPENASKVLDENGEPMVVWHRTNNLFNQFDPDRSREQSNWPTADFGFYFSNVNMRGHYGKYAMPVFLNIRNPRTITVDEYGDFDYGYKRTDPEEIRKDNDGLLINVNNPSHNEADKHFVIYNPNQAKSAIGNNGDFSEENDDIRFSISNQNNDIFYSNAERAVEGIKQEKATPEQWRAMIEKAGGLKAGEDKWIGLSDWLAQQRPTVTPQANETRSQFVERAAAENKRFTLSKQELLDYIREHKIQIEETHYQEEVLNGSDVLDLRDEIYDKAYDLMSEARDRFYDMDNEEESMQEAYEYAMGELKADYGDDVEYYYNIDISGDSFSIVRTGTDRDFYEFALNYYHDVNNDEVDTDKEYSPINSTRLRYTTEGLENKREIALTIPTIESWNENDEIHFGDAGEGRAIAWVRFGDAKTITKPEELVQAEQEYKEFSRKMIGQYGLTYTERVMSDSERQQESDLIAKLNQARKDHPQVEEKVLVIDEIQSKRHQEGREHGYIEKSADKAMTDYTNMLYRKYGVQFNVKMSDEERMEYRRLQREREFERQDNLSRPTPAPFEKNWHELAMKRILRFAAENGYDKVAWTTGDQQAARYNIGNHVDGIDANPFRAGVTPDIDYDGTQILIYTDGATLEMDVDKDGNVVKGYESASMEYEGKNISDIVGKEIARKLLTGEEVKLRGEDFRIGGEGMRGFYDDILPRFMQKYGKKWGVQVGEVTMPQLEDGYQTMHAIDINDAMRESVLEGQPMFSISGRGVNGTMKPQEGETRSQYIARVAETVKNMTPRNTTIDDAIRFSITVNHNSPYLLKRADGSFVDPETGERLGFDLRFIGKGEGNQAHGYGSYFSVRDLRDYAEGQVEGTYKGKTLSQLPNTRENLLIKALLEKSYYLRSVPFETRKYALKRTISSAKKNWEDMGYPERATLWMHQWLNDDDYLAEYQKFSENYDEWMDGLMKEIEAFDEKDFNLPDRHHYSVEIPDNDGTNYIEERQPMNARARKAIMDGLIADGYTMEEKDNDEFGWYEFNKGDFREDPDNQISLLKEDETYGDFIHDNFHGYDSKMLPKISEYLSKAGIVGIHYDGRRDGECYVIFNPDDAVITDHIRFSVTGSRGAANIDKMEGVTTRMDNLAAARQMEEDGKDAKTIRMATGWERGADGKWRYEIDDVQLNTDNVKANFRKLDRRGVTAPMVWYHNKFTDIIADSPERKQLLAAYPQLADLDIEFYDYPNKERGAYSSEKKKISINRANVRTVDECRSVLLHEIQHAIQEAELFAKGTSKEQIQLTWKLNNEVHNKVDEYFDKMGFKEWLTSHNGDKAFVNRLMQVIHMFPNRDFNIHYLFVETLPRDKQIDAIDVLGDANDVIQSNRNAIYGADRKGMTMKPDELYHNAAGEVESRNVQNRMSLTPEERRERLLAETEDVAREDQVVIMNAFDVANDSNEDDKIRFSVNNPSTLSRSETVTKALVQQANNNYNIMQSALKKVTADLKGIRAAMRMQSDYDRKVVDSLLNLYNTLLQENGVWAQYMPDTTRRIATQIVHAIGKQNITEEVNTIMDHMVHAQAKAAQRQWDKLRHTPIDKINISGVVMQGKVALEGQHALKAMNDALQANMTIEQIEEQINQLMDMEDNATDESLKTQYKGQWIGLTIAAQHLERLQHHKEERQQLDLELQSARSNKALKPAARQQLVNNIKQAMRDNYIEQAEAYTRSTQDLSEYVNTQEGRAKDFIRRQDANRDKIRSYAQRDLEGLATNPNRNRTRGNVARSIWDAFASPIRDLQSLLRLTGLHAPDGEGYLYNHFMRNWMDGADKERIGIVAASKTLDEKIAELTQGKYKTWEEAARKINDASHNMFTITMLNGVDGKDMPVTEEIPLNAGNALYIYAVNKMNDGRMKLNGMNITEEDVQALTDKVREQFGQEILDVVDWVQSEFFSQLRNRYNPTHEALFGAPMDAIENYFPLRINANARQQNEDLSEPDTDAARLLAGTSTGAIKRRTRNSLPLDVRNADFFQEVIRHISQMERWNAFAQWNRDANILFSDINFRNRIKGMKGTIYGEGDKLYNYMKDAFRVAIGTYKPKTDTFSEITLNMAKGVTSAKINFRIFTALKQIASFPAFFTYMQDGVFVQSYLRNWLKPHETMKWAKENLPNFEKRVSKRDMGDMRLMQRSTDWQWNKRILEWSSKYGMFFNVFFDTLTCATGARAVYDSHLADYMKKGYSEEDARNRARQDAEQAFNTSQQSSEGAFMSAVQQDRNLVTAALTVFRTSPIQYTRNFMYHTRNLLRKFGEGKRDEQIAFRMGQYKNDGLNDEQARKAAEKDYNKSLRQDIVGFVVYGALLNILWRLAGQIPYLLLGDDDDKKKQILDDATSGGAWFSPFTGLLGGGIVESALDGNGSVADMFAPEMPFTQDIKRAGQYLSNDKYAEFASQALSVLMQSGTGFDPLTASDMVSRIVTTLDSEEELDAATQALRVSQALLSIPQSQYEQMLIDKVVSGETDEDAALEDYIRYQKIHTAPLTWWLRGEESDEKAEENAEKRFNKLLTERDKLHNPEDYEE